MRLRGRGSDSTGEVPPHFLIIGAMKAGTTSLYAHLTSLQGAGQASMKELQYFTFLWRRPLDWYTSQFPQGVVTGEASPQYLFHPRAAERCASVLPRVKLIVMLRNPIERAYSHYRFEVNRGRERLSTFEEALDAEEERLAAVTLDEYDIRTNAAARFSYRTRGLYADQLDRWLKFYSRDQIRIVETQELARNPRRVVSGLAKWLGLPRQKGGVFTRENVGNYNAPISPQTRRQLAAYYLSHNERLFCMLGRRYNWD